MQAWMQLKGICDWIKYGFDWAVMKWCLGYGIYTKRILFTAIGVIVGFAVLYAAVAGDGTIKNYYEPSVAEHVTHFNALYFSTITFTTIGYGDYAPLGWLRMFAGTEGLLGLILMSVFTVSFARKLIR
ncbi:MAG: potassium channel family protein [Phycisphaerales bacterium]